MTFLLQPDVRWHARRALLYIRPPLQGQPEEHDRVEPQPTKLLRRPRPLLNLRLGQFGCRCSRAQQAEGRRRRDGDQRRHYEIAAGSASEVTAALRIALAKRYITEEDFAHVDALLDRVRAMLYRLTAPKRRTGA
jgi:hypothetical protein